MKKNLMMVILMSLTFGVPFLFSNGVVEGAEYCVSSSSEIQNALTAAASNEEDDLIQIVQGTYTGNFVYTSGQLNNLTIEGGYSTGCSSRTDPPANTVLDASGSGTVLQLNGSLDAIIDGITLQNGGNSGLIASLGRDFLISNCKIQYNTGNNGGGARLTAKKIEITNNTIMSNVAKTGGGVDIQGSTPEITTFAGNIISQNITNDAEGGGVQIKWGSPTVNFINNVISRNATTIYVGGGHGGSTH